MGFRKRGQVAFEYMVIVAVVIALLIPIWSYMSAVNERSTQTLAISQAQAAANKIVSSADLVYTQGPPTQLTVDVYIPKGVESASLTDTTVKFSLYFGAGLTDVFADSLAILDGAVPIKEGLYKFEIKAIGDYANISY